MNQILKLKNLISCLGLKINIVTVNKYFNIF